MRRVIFVLTVLIAFVALFCFVGPPAFALDSDSSRVATFADSSGDWSGGVSPDHDPDAPPREYDPGEAGLPAVDGSASSQQSVEATTSDDDPGEAGLPDDDPEIWFTMGEMVLTQDDDSGEAGLPTGAPDASQAASDGTTSDDDPGEAGLPTGAPDASQVASDGTTSDDDPGEAGLPAADGSETDLQVLNQSVENVHVDLWLVLFTVWGFAGIFLGYKVGGVVLGRL